MQSATRERRESRSCRGDMLISICKCKWPGYKYKTRGHALLWRWQFGCGLQPPKGFGEASVPDFRGPWPLRRAIFLPIEGVELAATSRDARRGGARGEKEQLIRTDY